MRAMGVLIPFEERAVARLKDRLGQAESARADLVAFAFGHAEAVASIHSAVLAAMEAGDVDELLATVTGDWPALLGVDSVTLALIVGKRAFLAEAGAVRRVERAIVERALVTTGDIAMRRVNHGHMLFGAAARAIRAEALVRVGTPGAGAYGLLAVGQRRGLALDVRHGGALLQFLGASLDAMIRRWTSPQTTLD
jgi:uncharacterized protein YigA (DUF484 family)